MKLKSLFIYAIILIAMACEDEKPQAIAYKANPIPNQYLALEDSTIIWHQDSLHFQGKPFSGKAYSLFANGDTAVYKEFWNGLQEGITKRWHPNKQLAEDRFYIAGKKEGKHRAWWPDGKPQFEFHVHEDAYEGELKEWNSKGLLIRQFHYQKGQEVGSQRLWWDDSTVRANYEIRDGKKYGLIGIKLCKNLMIQLNKNIQLFVLLLLVISCKPAKQPLGLPFISKPDFTPEWIAKTDNRYDSIHQIPSFRFQDQDGQFITEQSVTGKIYVANFIFTSCGSICPRMTENMSIVQKKYLNDKDVLILSHSVMPDRDSVPVLKNYANLKGIVSGKWFLLTGNIDSIYRMAKKEYYAGERIGYYGNQKDFLHTENCMLLDKHRRIRGIYNGTLPLEMERMIEDIEILKKETD